MTPSARQASGPLPAEPRSGRSVEAVVAYMKPIREKPRRYLYQPPAGEPEVNWEPEPRRVAIVDARPVADSLSLARQGFVLRRGAAPAIDVDDEAAVRARYYPEMEAAVRALTGAARVIAFDHNVRSGSKAARQRRGAFPPARHVHADYTLKSGPQRIRDVAGPEALAPGRSFQIINVWRPILHAVETDALAVIDAESVAQADLVATDLKYPDRTGEFYTVSFNAGHRWAYFPDMRPEEMLIFKCFDSRDPTRAGCVPHIAFADPAAGPDTRPRESIEVRTVAVLDDR